MRLLAGVRSDVNRQSASLNEGLCTTGIRALVVACTRVSMVVPNKVRLATKALWSMGQQSVQTRSVNGSLECRVRYIPWSNWASRTATAWVRLAFVVAW